MLIPCNPNVIPCQSQFYSNFILIFSKCVIQIINNLSTMKNYLADILNRHYPQRYARPTNHRQQSDHMFTPYIDNEAGKVVYLAAEYMPAHLQTSEEICSNIQLTFKDLIFKIRITLLERNFQQTLYLFIDQENIISLQKMVEVKEDCGELIQKEFLFDILDFIIALRKTLNKKSIPSFNLGQIGLLENKKLCLCDFRMFFKESIQKEYEQIEVTLSKNMQTLFKQIFKCQDPQQINQRITQLLGPLCESAMRQFIIGIVEERWLDNDLIKIFKQLKTKLNDQNTTVSNSFIDNSDQHDIKINQAQPKQVVKSSIIVQSEDKPKQKMKPLTKLIIVFFFLAVVSVAGYFTYSYLHRSIICEQGTYLNGKNQCLSCTNGCLRCSEGEDDKCLNCVSSMYLILIEEADRTGRCAKECKGRMKLSSNVCVIGSASKKQRKNSLSQE